MKTERLIMKTIFQLYINEIKNNNNNEEFSLKIIIALL
jgi:hypothetical protein